MPSVDGETAPRLGEDFRSKVCILLRTLGYVERLNRQDGIDWVGDPPLARRSLIRPLFSPNGRTAFEFRLGGISLPSVAENFHAKIGSLRDGGNPVFSNVVGGVLVTDGRISDSKIQTALESQVYCWDTRHLHFLAKKTDTFKSLHRSRQNVKEKRLDDWTTLFMNLSPYEGYMELKAYVFYQNPSQQIDTQKVENIIARFSRNVERITADFSSPIYIHLKIHSLAGVAEGAENTFRELTFSEENSNPRYDSAACFIVSYATAPWFVYCRETG
jgi:hypothetical protein